jgi:hypothetical protein
MRGARTDDASEIKEALWKHSASFDICARFCGATGPKTPLNYT